MRSVYAVQIIMLERTESSYPTKNVQKVTSIYSAQTTRTACQHFWAKFHTAVRLSSITTFDETYDIAKYA